MLKFLCRELSALGVKEPQYHFVAFIMKATVCAKVCEVSEKAMRITLERMKAESVIK